MLHCTQCCAAGSSFVPGSRLVKNGCKICFIGHNSYKCCAAGSSFVPGSRLAHNGCKICFSVHRTHGCCLAGSSFVPGTSPPKSSFSMGLSSPGIAKHTGSRLSAGQSGRPASSNPRGLKSPHKRTSRHPPSSIIDLTSARQDGQGFVDLTRDHDVPVQQDPVSVSHAGSGVFTAYRKR